MNAFADAALVDALLRTTLALSAIYLVAAGWLRLRKRSSPFVHRALCVLALAQGWWLVRFAVDVPWYEPPAFRPVATTPIIEEAGLPPLPEISTLQPNAPAPNQKIAAAAAPPRWNWRHGLFAVWLAGALIAVAGATIRYLRFAGAAPLGEPADSDDEAVWQRMLAERGVRRPIPLRMTANIGPVLCRLPGGYRLLAPREAWRDLSPESRLAMLHHELAHYERGDVWKSLAMRTLALPHWFNPLAWAAVRHFDEAAEWACDAAACKASPETGLAYGRALLSLAVIRAPQAVLNTAIQGRGLALRIERILAPNSPEDSQMKKLLWISIAAVLLLAGGIEFKLVARGGEDQADETQKDGLRTSPRHVQAATSMLEAAKKTYEATAAGYDAGTVMMPSVHTWSQCWLEAERGLAKTKQEQLAALLGHLQRMRRLHKKVEALYLHGSKGGELEKYHATKYYVAQAELWLVDAGGKVPADED